MLMMDSLLIALTIASVVSFGLLFLPAIFELKKPHDAGPRLIADVLGQKCLNPDKMGGANLEEASKIEGSSDGLMGDFSDSDPNLGVLTFLE